jgi:hypothetical protein
MTKVDFWCQCRAEHFRRVDDGSRGQNSRTGLHLAPVGRKVPPVIPRQ